jgi:hypothetical protein
MNTLIVKSPPILLAKINLFRAIEIIGLVAAFLFIFTDPGYETHLRVITGLFVGCALINLIVYAFLLSVYKKNRRLAAEVGLKSGYAVRRAIEHQLPWVLTLGILLTKKVNPEALKNPEEGEMAKFCEAIVREAIASLCEEFYQKISRRALDLVTLGVALLLWSIHLAGWAPSSEWWKSVFIGILLGVWWTKILHSFHIQKKIMQSFSETLCRVIKEKFKEPQVQLLAVMLFNTHKKILETKSEAAILGMMLALEDQKNIEASLIWERGIRDRNGHVVPIEVYRMITDKNPTGKARIMMMALFSLKVLIEKEIKAFNDLDTEKIREDYDALIMIKS